jgi:hypothetical protein
MEQSEYELFYQAVQRLEESPITNEPTMIQTIMAIVPNTIVCASSFFMLCYAYSVKGNPDMEPTSTIVSTILSFIIFIMCILSIAYQHHDKYDFISCIYPIIIRINLFQLIVCGSFISYVQTSGNYSTYFTWLYVITIPIIIMSFLPFVTGAYS